MYRGSRTLGRKTVLVLGLPGSGKSTYVKENLGDGICFDLDAIASAFRLKQPHEENDETLKFMANDLFDSWLKLAKSIPNPRSIFVIRVAPRMEEVYKIAPSKIVLCKRIYRNRPFELDMTEYERRIALIKDWARRRHIEIEERR